MKIEDLLDAPVSNLLRLHPIESWGFDRKIESDCEPPEIRYLFKNHDLEVHCDHKDENIVSIFIQSESVGRIFFPEASFCWCRSDVRKYFGKPEKYGEQFTDEFLGKVSSWDSFKYKGYIVHFQYGFDADDRVQMITLMSERVHLSAISSY